MKKLKIGFAPTRRSIFSAPDAIKFANLTRKKLDELNVDYVDINDINEEGLLYNEEDRIRVLEKFKKDNVKGLFIPHCNFGTEYIVSRLAKDLDVPVLLWGPLDERPEDNGVRLRDTQCGLFATGKVLRRFDVKFTYVSNCRLEDDIFKRGLFDFLAVCNVVDVFRNIRILQMGPRPFDFWSTMFNEGELLEKFNIQLAPVPLSELVNLTKKLKRTSKAKDMEQWYKEKMIINMNDDQLNTIAALTLAMEKLLENYHCNAGAVQCWNALQDELGIMPCAANAVLADKGYPIVCETDIHGAITSLLVEAATLDDTVSFFADWTVRHPDNPNGELLQHCGLWPISVAAEKPEITIPLAFEYPGSLKAKAKGGYLTLARFDGDHGEYSLLLGNAKVVEGPYTMGTYAWIEVENIKRLEAKIVEGPYIHHCTGIHKDVVPVLYESCKYIGIRPDLYDDNEEEIRAYLRGE
ncbi:MAG: fucose isomerase [Clostridiaceae bacterium]|nr:fucose isomerase [Clostridiaceae bacterium]